MLLLAGIIAVFYASSVTNLNSKKKKKKKMMCGSVRGERDESQE